MVTKRMKMIKNECLKTKDNEGIKDYLEDDEEDENADKIDSDDTKESSQLYGRISEIVLHQHESEISLNFDLYFRFEYKGDF